MDVQNMSDDELFENVELYQDRIETITEHISDAEDSNVRNVLEIQRSRYHNSITLLKSEINGRKAIRSNLQLNVDLSKIFDQLKSAILSKLELDFFADNARRFVRNAPNLQNLIDNLKLGSRHYHTYDIINEDILSIIPDPVLMANNIYLNKTDIVQKTGTSLCLNTKSKHINDSESYHYGNCISEHYDNAKSFHMDNCSSRHTDNCHSWHHNNCKSFHSGNSKSMHLHKSTYEGVKNNI